VDFAGSSLSGWAVIFAMLATIIIFGNAANWFDLPPWLYFLEDTQTQSLIVVILVFALIIWFITKEDKPKDQKKSMLDEFGKVMGYKRSDPLIFIFLHIDRSGDNILNGHIPRLFHTGVFHFYISPSYSSLS